MISFTGTARELSGAVPAVVAWLFSALLLGCSEDPTAADPLLILEDGFVTGREGTVILDEGGTITGGLDAWLKLLPSGDLRPRYEEAYRFQECGEPVAWFNLVLPGGELDPQTPVLVCRAYTNNAFDFSNGRWVIEDRATGIIYYRVWKQY